MTIKLNVGMRNALVDSISGNIGFGVLDVYTGAAPASADAAATGTLLVSIQLNGMTSASGGAAGLSSNGTGTAVATGTAGYGRWHDTMSSTLVVDGSVGTASTDFIISSITITSGDTVTLTALALSQPAS